MSKRKQIDQRDITGQRGINLIEKVVLAMGCLWHPTNLEAGIDGLIEIRDPATGVVTNCILQVQSKATSKPFQAESDTSFSYYCRQEDLDFWLGGNTPVILICSRPDDDQAYWAHVQERFQTAESRNTKTIRFDKARDSFDASCRERLVQIAVPRDSGLYLAPVPKHEVLETNLLPIIEYPETYFVAQSKFQSTELARKALRDADIWLDHAWYIKGGNLISLHDIGKGDWEFLYERGTIEELPFKDWVFTEDEDDARDLVRLLGLALTDTLRASGIHHSGSEHQFYFRAPRNLQEEKRPFQARMRQSARTIFKGYGSKKNPGQISYYRHMAFRAGFVRIGLGWCLEISPSYHFTWNGKKIHPRHASLLSGIRRLDGARSVSDQVVMWASLLAAKDLFSDPGTLLGFGKLLTVELNAGINDKEWQSREDDASFIVTDVEAQGDQLSLL